jgi:hypothetical protein
MKNKFVLTLLSVIAVAFTSNAQIQKGNVFVGGNFANIILGLDNSKVFALDISPKAAWFVQDNVALGGYVNLGIQTETAKGSGTATNYGLGGLGRCYTGADVEVLRHGRFFAEGTAGIGGNNVSNGGGNTSEFNFGVGPGFAYFVTPKYWCRNLIKV